MSQAEIARLRSDLQAIRNVLYLDGEGDRMLIYHGLAVAIAGLPVAAVTAWTRTFSADPTFGSLRHWAFAALLLAPLALVLCVTARILRLQSSGRALLAWRRTLGSAAFVTPLLFAIALWVPGLSPGTIARVTVLLIGLASVAVWTGSRGNLLGLGWAVATVLVGVWSPAESYEAAGMLAGGWLIVAGLGMTALAARDLGSAVETGDADRL